MTLPEQSKNIIERKLKEHDNRVIQCDELLHEAKLIRMNYILTRYKNLLPMLNQHDPDKYSLSMMDFQIDERHAIYLKRRGNVATIQVCETFRGEWDETDIDVPWDIFIGEETAEAYFRAEAERIDKERKEKEAAWLVERNLREFELFQRLKKKYGDKE